MISKNEWVCRDIKEFFGFVSNDTSKKIFSVQDFSNAQRLLQKSETFFNKMVEMFHAIERQVKEAEWQAFVATLPQIDIDMDTDGFCLYEKVWQKVATKEIFGLTAGVYRTETSDSPIYLFDDRYYYDVSVWGAPELLTREQMGLGEHTIYERTNNSIKVKSSGTVNFYDYVMAISDNGTKPPNWKSTIGFDAFENPIIEREDIHRPNPPK